MADIFGYEVSTEAKVLVTVFWVMTPCGLVCGYQHFERKLIVSAFSRITATMGPAKCWQLRIRLHA